MGNGPRRLALVASKGTLDQAYPPLILATTAASMGWEAGIFFTFYGLDILHKERIKHLQDEDGGEPAPRGGKDGAHGRGDRKTKPYDRGPCDPCGTRAPGGTEPPHSGTVA